MIPGSAGAFPFNPEQREQPEQSEQPEQPEQPEQSEQREQREQREQPKQSEQPEQSEQSEQPEQSFNVASDARAFSSEPHRSIEALLPFSSFIHVIIIDLQTGRDRPCRHAMPLRHPTVR